MRSPCQAKHVNDYIRLGITESDFIDQPKTDENSEDIGSTVLSKTTVNDEGLLFIY
jgi:hypothetical protein